METNKHLTKEQIREKANEFYLIKVEKLKVPKSQFCEEIEVTIKEGMVEYFVEFAQSLFQETEEETWDRVYSESRPNSSIMLHEIAEIYHQERKRIENGN